jgi:hypothetical protein
MNPQQGQSEAQRRIDAEECDAWAKAKSEYSRSAEAAWVLFAIPLAAVLLPTVIALEIIDVVTLRSTPLRDRRLKSAKDGFDLVMPKEPGWGQYFAEYRQCMSGRGYLESPRYSTRLDSDTLKHDDREDVGRLTGL